MSQKPLVLSDIRSRAGAFVAQWKDAEGYERGEAQSFIRDLLEVFGIARSTAVSYEKRALRASTGKRGYIDALISGTAIIEMKSAGEDLEKAEAQALDYRDSITDKSLPDYILCSDFRRFRLTNLLAEPDEQGVIEFDLADLPIHAEDLMFLAGYRRTSFGSVQQEAASIKAAQLMAKLYEHLEKTGYDDHQASIFLIRTLFCLYADDSGLWERDLFSRWIEERTSEDGSDLGSQLATLYQALNRPEEKRYGRDDDLLMAFPYVNGSVFGEAVDIPHFDRASRELLLQAAYFNWSSISPAIFGSLFQAVKDKKARRSLGEHYTTETNILKVIRPLFLDELEERFTKARARKGELEKLLDHLGSLSFLDPACGCGNFLIIAYRELRALELRIHQRLQELRDEGANRQRGDKLSKLGIQGNDQRERGVQLALGADDLVRVKLAQFHGIELEEWPATIARTAMFLVEHQANQDMSRTLGYAAPMLPLEDSAQITVGNALRTDWADVLPPEERTIIMGNPPFLGHYTRTSDQAEELREVWQRKDIGHLDYVTGWYRKALDFYGDVPGRFGFVSTNSITQGEPVSALFGPVFDTGWRIRFAHRTFAWTSEAPGAAAVHCVIVGFDRETKPAPRLITYARPKGAPEEIAARTINGYLVDAPRVSVDSRRATLSDVVPPVQFGSMPNDGGHLLVDRDDHREVAEDPIANKYLRRFVGARELLHDAPRWCLWMENLDPKDPGRSAPLHSRIEATKDYRSASRRAATNKLADTPALFGERRQPTVPYVCIPRHFSETRNFATVAHFDPDVISGDANFTAEDPSGFLFGIISSSMFMAWQRATGGRIKSDLRFSATVVWNNLPLPEITDKLRDQVIAGGRAVLEARALHPERSLAEHYAPLAMDPALLKAHRVLDTAVDKAFGARRLCSSEQERQQILFERYADLTADEHP
ncbi:DNA methyltransferase [Brachybacterium kimchii]|uniref:site-specific DNA-methyltransferase (adenine-specific) n=1 Tax=Brachybacterium kimchii TaxID=2942909 RepID=A0ABY4N7J7_9MICO|nr:DNA methyltransferase [Brachybacterium kimchii]UQN30522.1 class I SAM-dependent DNA methyltransferase [Brachybacterium kimchii]